ncbi:MAG: RNA polymerase sigma factor [Gammaproteobacteria bacterium]|nr:RNA polymerase sigma factor [Gammaproteobacteria bacterium]
MAVAETAAWFPTSGHGSGEFVAALFRRHRKALLWYLKELVGSPDEAEDILQEAFLRLLRTAKLDEDLVRARNYLFKTATNIARDGYRRRQSRRDHLHVAVESVEVAAGGHDFGRMLDAQRGACVLHAALKDLLPRTRTAFLLHWREEMTYGEIAAELGVSRKTIERDVALTLEVCRSRMQEGRHA